MIDVPHGISFEKIADLLTAGLFSLFGGTAAYVYRTIKSDKGFTMSSFLVNAFLAFFVGNLVGSMIPLGMAYRDGLLMSAGFASFPILAVLELFGKRAVLTLLNTRLGTNIQIEDETSQTKDKPSN